MNQELTLQEFLQSPGVIFDVRTPAEYSQGRIPGSLNLPLFSNEERAQVGTAYKRLGRNAAIELGLQLIGPKMATLAKEAQNHIENGVCRVHCWRGGLRSYSLSWLLNLLSIKTVTLKGGYKTFRRKVLEDFNRLSDKSFRFVVIGGMTGSGKTEILRYLKEKGEQVLDLEKKASHRGSSFGQIGMPDQPSNEQFENEIALKLSSMDTSRVIWIEDESRFIGSCQLPNNLIRLMRTSPAIIIETSLEKRVQRICSEYPDSEKEAYITATKRIAKKLGGSLTQSILKCIEHKDYCRATEQLLFYYDKTYNHSLNKRSGPIHQIKANDLSIEEWADKILSTKIS